MKDSSRFKQASLFKWVKCKGFTSTFMKETNTLIQSENVSRGFNVFEFHQLCNQLALNPLKQASRRFVEKGVAAGKYNKFPNPDVQGEYLYTLKKFSKMQQMERSRSQVLEQSKEATKSDAKNFKQLVSKPLMASIMSSSAPKQGGGNGGKKHHKAIEDRKKKGKSHKTAKSDDDESEDEEAGDEAMSDEDGHEESEDEIDDERSDSGGKDPGQKGQDKKAYTMLGQVQKLIAQAAHAEAGLKGSCGVSNNLKNQFKSIGKQLKQSRDQLNEAITKNAARAKISRMCEKLDATVKVVIPLIAAAENMAKPKQTKK